MAYTFPLALTDFFAPLVITQITFSLGESIVSSGLTGAGEVLTANQGARLWGGDVIFPAMMYQDADAVMAKIQILQEAGRSFFISHGARVGPQADPTGSILGGATPEISSVASNNRDLTIKALPVGYVLTVGDLLAFQYSTSPVRNALHRVVQGATADGSGNATVEVTGSIRPGAAANAVITLVNPACKAIIVPGTTSPGTYGDGANTGMKFSWRQTLR